MPDPLDPAPNEDVPTPPFPEVDPASTPDEAPQPGPLPDDGLGRPVDGSVMGAGDADPA